MILLVDMDSFFAQVEQRNNPALRGKPILVGGNADMRHGVVAAASYEAKRYGVKSGMSYFEAKKLCPHAITVSGNTDKYVDTCYNLLGIFRKFTDRVECYSIDEAFLDVSTVEGLHGSPEQIGWAIKKRVKEELNLTCSVGIGPNKLVSKMACKWDKPDGLSIVHQCELPHILWGLPVDDIVGIGRRLKKRLGGLGITTIGELAHYPADVLRRKFGVYGDLMHQWANGIDESPVDPGVHLSVKSMGHSYTMPRDIDDPEELRWYMFWLADRVGRRLRRDNYHGRTVSLVVRTADFSGFSRDHTIPHPTDDPHLICKVSMDLLFRYFPEQPIRLLGVKVSQLQPATPRQLQLYGQARSIDRALQAMDIIKDKYGDRSMTFASLMQQQGRVHQKIGVFLSNKEKGNKRSPLMPEEVVKEHSAGIVPG